MTDKAILQEKAAEIEKRDPEFIKALRRARGFTILGTAVIGAVLALAAIALLQGLQNKQDIQSIQPFVEQGPKTCSGGNLAACDRVCVSTAARLVIKTKDGAIATVYCKKSRVSAQIGGTHTPVGLVVPGHTSGGTPASNPSSPSHQTPQNGSGGTRPQPTPRPPAVAPTPTGPLPAIPQPLPAPNCQINLLGVEVCL